MSIQRYPLRAHKTAHNTTRKPVRWNIDMFDVDHPRGIQAPLWTVRKRLTEDQAFETMARMERRNVRMGYGAHAVKH